MRQLALAIIVLATGAFPAYAEAQSGTFVVRPAKVELSGKPGDTLRATITLENRLGVPATFNVSFEDVEGSDNPEDPVLLLGGKRGPYPLRDLLFAPRSVSLVDGEEERVAVSVRIPADASPGGLYGSVVFTPLRTAEVGNVIPDSRIGVLFFVRVEGEALEEGKLRGMEVVGGSVRFGKPDQETVVRLEYENTGTVHLNPYGIYSVSNLADSGVERPIDPWYVLPKNVRVRDIAIADDLSYGRNAIAVRLNRGYDDIIDAEKAAVWVFPPLSAIGIILTAIILVAYLAIRRGRRIHVV